MVGARGFSFGIVFRRTKCFLEFAWVRVRDRFLVPFLVVGRRVDHYYFGQRRLVWARGWEVAFLRFHGRVVRGVVGGCNGIRNVRL